VSAESTPSRWWAAVAGYPLLLGLGWVLASLAPRLLADAPNAGTVVGLLASLCFAGATLVYAPLLPLALYRDAAALRESGAAWSPSPVRWGLIGLPHAFAPLLSAILLVSLAVALLYLALRFRRVGIP
jgi:hypothetical protein